MNCSTSIVKALLFRFISSYFTLFGFFSFFGYFIFFVIFGFFTLKFWHLFLNDHLRILKSLTLFTYPPIRLSQQMIDRCIWDIFVLDLLDITNLIHILKLAWPINHNGSPYYSFWNWVNTIIGNTCAIIVVANIVYYLRATSWKSFATTTLRLLDDWGFKIILLSIRCID